MCFVAFMGGRGAELIHVNLNKYLKKIIFCMGGMVVVIEGNGEIYLFNFFFFFFFFFFVLV